MSYDRLTPTISSKAKKLFGFGNTGKNNWGAVPLSSGLDTRPCKILDPRLLREGRTLTSGGATLWEPACAKIGDFLTLPVGGDLQPRAVATPAQKYTL